MRQRRSENGAVHPISLNKLIGDEAARELERFVSVETEVRLFELSGDRLGDQICDMVREQSVGCLLLPRQPGTRAMAEDLVLERRLYRDAPCITAFLTATSFPSVSPSIVVPAAELPQSRLVLQLAASMADRWDGTVAAVHVEPRVDEVSHAVGDRVLDRVLRADWPGDINDVERRVVVDDDLVAGIRSTLSEGDLVIFGSYYHGPVHHMLFRGTSERVPRRSSRRDHLGRTNRDPLAESALASRGPSRTEPYTATESRQSDFSGRTDPSEFAVGLRLHCTHLLVGVDRGDGTTARFGGGGHWRHACRTTHDATIGERTLTGPGEFDLVL